MENRVVSILTIFSFFVGFQVMSIDLNFLKGENIVEKSGDKVPHHWVVGGAGFKAKTLFKLNKRTLKFSEGQNAQVNSTDVVIRVSQKYLFELSRGIQTNISIRDVMTGQVITQLGHRHGILAKSNPSDVALTEDALWVSFYGHADLLRYPFDGKGTFEKISLASYDKNDGIPEAVRLIPVLKQNKLYVVCQLLHHWAPVQSGKILEVDLKERSVTRTVHYPEGVKARNPNHFFVSDEGPVLMGAIGDYGKVDDEILEFDPETGAVIKLLDLQFQLTDFMKVDDDYYALVSGYQAEGIQPSVPVDQTTLIRISDSGDVESLLTKSGYSMTKIFKSGNQLFILVQKKGEQGVLRYDLELKDFGKSLHLPGYLHPIGMR